MDRLQQDRTQALGVSLHFRRQKTVHGLGPWPEVDLIEARDKAFANRKMLIEGIDPLVEKHTHKPRKVTTFAEVADDAINRFKSAWKGPKQEPQWRYSLKRYAYPILGEMHVASITPEHVRDVLEPIWIEKAPTAERVQNRIERILDFATVQKLRAGDNPARYKGNLEHAIAIVRDLQRKLANKCHAKGINPADIALASLYSAFDVAEGAKGLGLGAVEWLRTGLYVIERKSHSQKLGTISDRGI